MKAMLCALLFLVINFATGCHADSRLTPKAEHPRRWGKARADLLVPDTAIYHLVKYLVQHPIVKWEQGDSSAPFSYGPVMFDARLPIHSSGPDLPPGELTRLYQTNVLTATDTAFMRAQQLYSHDFRLDTSRLPGCTLVPIDTLLAVRERDINFLQVIYRRYGHAIYGVSLPFFSKDYRVAVLEINYSCGALCGVYNTVVLRRRNQRWYLVKIISTAQS